MADSPLIIKSKEFALQIIKVCITAFVNSIYAVNYMFFAFLICNGSFI